MLIIDAHYTPVNSDSERTRDEFVALYLIQKECVLEKQDSVR